MTNAKEQGIVLGKTYRVVGPQNGSNKVNASGGTIAGSLVVLTEDDGTHMPFFNRVDEKGNVLYKTCCINIFDTKLVAVEPEVTELPAVHISLNGNSTTIVIQKRLTPDEMHAVLAEVGL